MQRYLDALKNAGLIRITDGEGGTDQRKIFAGVNPLSDPHDKIDTGGDKKNTAPVTELSPPYKELNKKEDQETPQKPPRGRRACRSSPDWEPEIFAKFWAAYPRGEDKQGAMREWDALRPDADLIRVMAGALQRQLATEEWQRGVGIPYACRWLKYRRWEDDLAKGPARAPARAVESPEVAQW